MHTQVIENPGTGSLVGHEVIEGFMPYSVMVDYCFYGSMMKKHTCLWWSFDPTPFFAPGLCLGPGRCTAMTFNGKHGNDWETIPLVDRYNVPATLSMKIAEAIEKFLSTQAGVFKRGKLGAVATDHEERLHAEILAAAAAGGRGQRGSMNRRAEQTWRQSETGQATTAQRALDGRRVRKLFLVKKSWRQFTGTVHFQGDKNPEHPYHVKYYDGDSEDMDEDEVDQHLIKD